MGEQRQIRTRSWNRMPTKRCRANGITDEFIFLDDDEVIILDFPESSKRKASGTSRTRSKPILERVISIDDDDDTYNVHKAGSSSSRKSLAARLQTSVEVDDDDCQFIQEKCAAFRFSKCKQTFSTKASSGNRFGLGSESDFSDNDCSDCEIFEGSHKEVREQWEKAFLKKMKTAGKSGLSEEAGPSNIHCDTNFDSDYQTSSYPSRNPDGEKETSSTFFETDNGIPKTSLFGSEVEDDNRGKNCANSSFCNKENISRSSSLFPEIQVEHERFDSQSTHFTSSKEPLHQSSFEEVEKQPDRVQVQCETSQSAKENQEINAAYQSCTMEVEEEDTSISSPSQTYNADGGTTPVVDDAQDTGARCELEISSLGESGELLTDPFPSTSGEMQGINGTAPAIVILLDREKLKETDAYKKAQEKEWESRQQQLQIQAEEAQRQRKRRKLENTRQLEVERRQKERLEEVRETQKKDEESMNMKEKVRAEVTKSLKLLELKCNNMASLLRCLGIHVAGGTSPFPHEVHAAYKQAVLKFHPDRASRGDIKHQVEAEEKFKLIARMKGKFLP